MTKTLNMPFRNAAGKEVNFTLANPKDGSDQGGSAGHPGVVHQ